MRTIVIGNLKGGTGKTTTTINLSYTLAKNFEKKVLVIDMDPQSNTTAIFTKANRIGCTVKDVLTNPDKIAQAIYRTKYKNIDIIKGDAALRETDVTDFATLQVALSKVADKYNICVIDTRPVFEQITKAALYAADVLFVPVCLDKFCRDNLTLVEEAMDMLPFERAWRAFANKVDCRRRTQRKVYEDLMQRHNYPFLHTCISNSAAIDNALELSKPVMAHRSKSSAARDYVELATEIIGAISVGGDR